MHSLNRHPHQQQPCLDCDLPTQERLNYFTGQFLAERDLRAEQEYHIAKHRQHNRYLHGHGTVCGLKVAQHPNPACRDRFVVLEPGLALDCCGREIVVHEPVYVDLVEALAAQKADPTITGQHLLLSLCYSECKTEFVPALYAECGCTDTGCEANRIYEGFEIEAKLVDDSKLPKPKGGDPSGMQLDWTTTLTTDKALRVAIDPKQTRIYVLNAATPNQVMVYDTEHYCLLRSISFDPADGRIIDLAVSSNGNFLYVLRYVEDTANPGLVNYFLRVIKVKDTTTTTGDDLNPAQAIASVDTSGDIPLTSGASTPPPRFAVGSKDTSGKVVTLDVNATPKKITIWTERINADGANPAALSGDVAYAKYYEGDMGAAQAIAMSPDGSWLFIAEPNIVRAFKVATLQSSPTQPPTPTIHTITIPNNENPLLITVSGDSLWLYVITETKKVYVFRIQETPTLFPAVNTTGVDLGTDTDTPIALQVSPTGKWGYVLLQGASDATKGWVKVINRDKLLDDPGQAVSGAIAVAANPRDLALAADGQRLYAAGEGADKACGGVSVLNVSEDHCKDLFWRSLEHCPECVETCIPLAVVKDYATDAVVTDARINNRIRPLVPSTETLQQLILCALNSTSVPALPTTGAGVKSASAQSVEPGDDADAVFEAGTGNIHFKIPKGADGQPGQNGTGINGRDGEGLEANLTQIEALSWTHNTGANPIATIIRLSGQQESPGIVIAFTQPVLVANFGKPFDPPNQIDAEHVFQVLVEDNPDQDRELGIICRCPVIGKVVAVEPTEIDGEGRIISAQEIEGPYAMGAAFIFGQNQFERLENLTRWGGFSIRLQGDFVVDEEGKAIDAEFVRGTLRTGDRPAGAAVGVQGGLFESWFWLGDKPIPREPQ